LVLDEQYQDAAWRLHQDAAWRLQLFLEFWSLEDLLTGDHLFYLEEWYLIFPYSCLLNYNDVLIVLFII
jgi:hypothetical protein